MPAPTRRTFLALGALTGLQFLCGCTDDHAKSTQQVAEDADRPLRIRQLAATDSLLTDYDAVIAASPADADRLGDLREDLLQHREALARSLPVSWSSASPTAAATARSVTDLAAAERRTAGLRLADLAAASPALARTLASIAASGAAHTAALGDTAPLGADAAPSSSPSPSPSPSPSGSGSAAASPVALSATDTAALQGALAAEHAAVYGYGVVGAFLPVGAQREDGRAAYTAHQARRDSWQRLLASGGASPTAAAAGYRLPFQVKDAATAGQLAVYLEIQLTAAYTDLAATAAFRADGATALRECALRAVHWGADLPALPGLAPTEPTPTAS
ncbi:ferritin-like domain-containing protein [Streptomyces sp. TLI_171]|uniref:ferritin-like domain-containing protein n=1 Tax=Streptomyces sp. TLI_171 TaxID=1938859 RepID=UPI000C19900D|nr:ferritin-like domain-containing protein [Streptomyces sp. TLI_171]RKE21431.1 uncharacterized protein DUF4439 [Streptomyces sp. TLI_171]